MNQSKGELIITQYGGDTRAASLDRVEKTPYTVYITQKSSGSLPTIKSTLGKISQYLFNCPPHVAPWHMISSIHFTTVKGWLESQGMAPKTTHRHLSILKSVVKTAMIMGLTPEELKNDFNIIMSMPNVKGSQGRGVIAPHRELSSNEISMLFQSLANDKTIRGARDLAILSVMRGCGFRRMEGANLNMEDVRFNKEDNGEIIVRMGKGGKTRTAHMPVGLSFILQNWLKYRGMEDGPLFCAISRSGNLRRISLKDIESKKKTSSKLGQLRALDVSSVNQMMTKRLFEADVQKATPHDLRYTFAQVNLKESDLQTVCDLLGHTSVSTTSIYVQTSVEKLRQVVAKDDVFKNIQISD